MFEDLTEQERKDIVEYWLEASCICNWNTIETEINMKPYFKYTECLTQINEGKDA